MKLKKSIIIEELRLLENENGRVTPEDLVAAAQAPDHPLHPLFEWNDSEAARAYRLNQAREILRIRVTVHDAARRTISVPVYLSDETGDGYTRTARIKSDADLAREALVREWARVASTVRRCKDLASYLDLDGEVEAIEVAVHGLMSKIQEAAYEERRPI